MASVTQESSQIRLINSCFVCNVVFLTKRKVVPTVGMQRLRSLRDILLQGQIEDEDTDTTPESNVLCHKCDGAVDEVLRLRKQIHQLLGVLEEIRRLLAKRIVDTYASTNANRKNYALKRKLYEAWHSKCDNISVSGSTDLQQLLTLCDGPTHQNQNSQDSHENDDNFSTGCPSPRSLPHSIDDNDFLGMSDARDGGGNDNLPEVHTESLNKSQDGPESILNASNSLSEPAFINSSILDNSITGNVRLAPEIQTKPQPSIPLNSSTEPSNEKHKLPGEDEWTDKRRNRPIFRTKRRNHPCRFCGKLFPSQFSLEMHERTHTGLKPFTCSICGKPFAIKSAMQKHELTHDPTRYQGEPKFECDICGKKYHIEGTLYIHKRDQHKGIKRLKRRKPRDPNVVLPAWKKIKKSYKPTEKRFFCKICEKPFSDVSTMKDHTKSHDPTPLYNKLFKYPCPACPPEKLAYSSTKAVRSHWREAHADKRLPDYLKKRRPPKPEQPKKFACTKCPPINGKVPTYRNYSSLFKHNILHHSGKEKNKAISGQGLIRYQCPGCPNENSHFPTKKSVVLHWGEAHPDKQLPEEFIKQGPPKGTYTCTKCPAVDGKVPTYSNVTTLYRHEKNFHSENGKFKGKSWKPRTGKIFSSAEKPWQCTSCGVCFARKGNLHRHMESHGLDPTQFFEEEGKREHVCNFCGKIFTFRTSLHRHREIQHMGLEEKYRSKLAASRKRYREKLKMTAASECQICGKEFKNLHRLNQHKRYVHAEKKVKCGICERPCANMQDMKNHEKTHNPKYLYNKLFRYQCPGCSSEKLPFPSKKSIVKHWRKSHAEQPIPSDFQLKKPPRPSAEGEYTCKICHAVNGKVPTYRLYSSLLKHNKLYHSENGKLKGRAWKPVKQRTGYDGVGTRRAKSNDETITSNEDSESDSASDMETDSSLRSDSDVESDYSENTATTEQRKRSVRQTRGKFQDFSKFLRDTDSEDDFVEHDKTKISKTKIVAVTIRKKSTTVNKYNSDKSSQPGKLSESFVRTTLMGKELRIILKRVDQDEINSEQSTSSKSAKCTREKPKKVLEHKESNDSACYASITGTKLHAEVLSMKEDSDDPLSVPGEDSLGDYSRASDPDQIKIETEDCATELLSSECQFGQTDPTSSMPNT